mgnify:FL=1
MLIRVISGGYNKRMLDAGTIGKTIRSLREQRGMSQEVLSGLAGMYKSHLGRIERGEKKPNLDSLCRIASALGMQPHELLKRIEEQAQTP